MQPVDPAALTAAIETVRKYDASEGTVSTREHERALAAFRFLARELVRLIDAGEAVRKVVCDLCEGDGTFAAGECAVCDGNGYALEPLFAKDKP